MTSLYWIEEALAGLLPTLWMFVGVGLPWAFATLSPRQWHSLPLVAAVALALGPAWVTAWMLALGVLGAQLQLRSFSVEWILLGTVSIALAGVAIAWRKRHRLPARDGGITLAFDEKLIIALIAIALVLRWVHTAFWSFTAYDALWVYGYQGRLYFLEGYIPESINYYPQFLQLQFAYVQVLIGEINDHAARMVLPMLHLGSVLAAYLLGARLLSRRAGLLVAVLWSLHPHVGQWSVVGDLEIPLTFSFTLAAVFFLRAWTGEEDASAKRGDALLAGLILGIALFTKPTSGAFIWGVLLLVLVDLLRLRFDFHRWKPRLMVACWTGLACLPLGAAWYLRNLLLGHDAIIFPKSVWLTRALRSGDYLGPLILALALVYLAVALRRGLARREWSLGALGFLLVLAGVLASNSNLFPWRADPPASYIRLEEALAVIAGMALMLISLRRAIRQPFSEPASRMVSIAAWCLLLALPYFITFFYSYSYHYRLGFAIVPLLCLPAGIALSVILDPARMRVWGRLLRRLYYLSLALLSLPGIVAVGLDVHWSSVWLAREDLDSDIKKYQVFNPSLMEIVVGLEEYRRDQDEPPIVLAPGEERLPFFFPQMEIIDQLVTELDEYESLGATHFIYGAKAREAYQEAGLDPARLPLIAALGKHDLFQLQKWHYDAIFSYELYRTRDFSVRRELPRHFQDSEEVIFGGRLQLYPRGVFPQVLYKNTPMTLEPSWQALQPLERDYRFVLQLVDPAGEPIWQEWVFEVGPHRHGHYASSLWDVGDYVHDRQVFDLDWKAGIPKGQEGYHLRLGVWDPLDEVFLPLVVEGVPSGEFYPLPGSLQIGS